MSLKHHLPISAITPYDPHAQENIEYLNSLNLLALGVVPYPRITPAFFLDTYQIYSAHHPTDVDVMRDYVKVFTLAERSPKDAAKVRATNYIAGNHHFQGFVRSRRQPPTILISNASKNLTDRLDSLNFNYISTAAEISETFKTKKAFREALHQLDLPHIPYHFLIQNDLQNLNYCDYLERFGSPSVVQRAEKEVGGNQGTFFIHCKEDFKIFVDAVQDEDDELQYLVSPFISGDSLSMAGCVTSQGTLTGALQLQLIDVPESLHCIPANGVFYGNDWGYKNWDESIQKIAQHVIEQIGAELAKDGFVGIFGIDFMLDTASNQLYPLECNPRITGSMPAHSLMLLHNNTPPFEYYHLLALTGRDQTFNFGTANESLKTTSACAHISFSPVGIHCMEHELVAGVYSYDLGKHALHFERPGLHYSDITHDNEFILIDTVPKLNESISQNVPGLFKFLFPHQIATSSHEINQRTSIIMKMFCKLLHDNCQME